MYTDVRVCVRVLSHSCVHMSLYLHHKSRVLSGTSTSDPALQGSFRVLFSDGEKPGSSCPRSLRACSVIESLAGAFGSARLHPRGRVPILNILFGFSLGSSIMPGVTC